MIRKFLAGIAVVMACAVAPQAFAVTATISVDGMSEAQIAELKAIAAAKVAEVAKSSTNAATTPLDIGKITASASTWGTQAAVAAEGFAKALGIAAKELGVTVNDFLKTDAGKLTAMVIIWKLVGASILKMLAGLGLMTLGLIIGRVLFLRLFTSTYEKVEYSHFGGAFKGTRLIRVPKSIQELRTDGEWLAFWLSILIPVVLFIIGAVII